MSELWLFDGRRPSFGPEVARRQAFVEFQQEVRQTPPQMPQIQMPQRPRRRSVVARRVREPRGRVQIGRSLKGGVSFSLCASCLKTKTELLFNHVLMDRHRNRSKLTPTRRNQEGLIDESRTVENKKHVCFMNLILGKQSRTTSMWAASSHF